MNRRTAQKILGTIDFDAASAMSRKEATQRAQVWSLAIAGTAGPVLLTFTNPKMEKSNRVLAKPTAGVMLVPSTQLGTILSSLGANDPLSLAVLYAFQGIDTCPWASKGCREACLFRSGHGAFDNVALARAWRTAFLLADPVAFVALLVHELRSASKRYKAVRLNVTQDIDWTKVCPQLVAWILDTFGDGSLYDYSKDESRVWRARSMGYDVSYSCSERTNVPHMIENIRSGKLNRGVVVFGIRARKDRDGNYPPLPTTWNGLRVVDGDVHDYRPADGRGVIVGLRVKDTFGRSSVAAATASGFAQMV